MVSTTNCEEAASVSQGTWVAGSSPKGFSDRAKFQGADSAGSSEVNL